MLGIPIPQVLLLKIAIGAAILIGACTATWFAADAYYSRALAKLQGEDQGITQALVANLNDRLQHDNATAKEVNDEAQSQIGDMAAVISDLSVRLDGANGKAGDLSRRLVTSLSSSCPAGTDERSGGRSATGGETQSAAPSGTVAIDAAALDDALTIGIKAIDAELLFRQFERGIR